MEEDDQGVMVERRCMDVNNYCMMNVAECGDSMEAMRDWFEENTPCCGGEVTDPPTAPPTNPPTDPPTEPGVMVMARSAIALTKRGTSLKSYFTKSIMKVAFEVNGEFTEELDFFEGCTTGTMCPPEYVTFGPFDAEPTKAKMVIYAKGRKIDAYRAANFDMMLYEEGADPSTATEKCVAEKWDTSTWIGRQGTNDRTYNVVDKCPCQPLKPKAMFNMHLMENTSVEQRIFLEFYQPCTDSWLKRTVKAQPGTKNLKITVGSKLLPYYPSKVKITKTRVGSDFTIKKITLGFKPDINTAEEKNLISVNDRPRVEFTQGDVLEFDLVYNGEAPQSRRLEVEQTHPLMEALELQEEDLLEDLEE